MKAHNLTMIMTTTAIAEPAFESIPVIPDRIYNKIGDVAEIVGVKPYVLRYWETEFTAIAPSKTETGQRVYTKSDIETVLLIKRLLYTEKYSIEGAKIRLKELRQKGELAQHKKHRFILDERRVELLATVKNELRDMVRLMDERLTSN